MFFSESTYTPCTVINTNALISTLCNTVLQCAYDCSALGWSCKSLKENVKAHDEGEATSQQ